MLATPLAKPISELFGPTIGLVAVVEAEAEGSTADGLSEKRIEFIARKQSVQGKRIVCAGFSAGVKILFGESPLRGAFAKEANIV